MMIKQSRQIQKVSFNFAYRWFCGLYLMYKIPDYSTFSLNRRRRFQEPSIF